MALVVSISFSITPVTSNLRRCSWLNPFWYIKIPGGHLNRGNSYIRFMEETGSMKEFSNGLKKCHTPQSGLEHIGHTQSDIHKVHFAVGDYGPGGKFRGIMTGSFLDALIMPLFHDVDLLRRHGQD